MPKGAEQSFNNLSLKLCSFTFSPNSIYTPTHTKLTQAIDEEGCHGLVQIRVPDSVIITETPIEKTEHKKAL
jgi:hypothetical protein